MTGVWRALRFALGHAKRTDARRLAVAVVLMVSGYAATPLIAWCLGALTNTAVAGDAGAAVRWSASAVLLLVAELSLAHFAHLYYFELGERLEVELSAGMFAAVNGSGGLERLQRKDFNERLTLVGQDLEDTHRSIETVLQSMALTVQIAVTSMLLGLLDPWLLLLPLAAVPPILAARRAHRMVDATREATASALTLASHLVDVAAAPASAKEIRLSGAEGELAARHARAWRATCSMFRSSPSIR